MSIDNKTNTEIKKDAKTVVKDFVKKHDKALIVLGALGVGVACVIDPVVGASLTPLLAAVGVANTIMTFGKNAKDVKKTADDKNAPEQTVTDGVVAGVTPGQAFEPMDEVALAEWREKLSEMENAEPAQAAAANAVNDARRTPRVVAGRVSGREKPNRVTIDRSTTSERNAELVRQGSGRATKKLTDYFEKGCQDRHVEKAVGYQTLLTMFSSNGMVVCPDQVVGK